MFLDEERLVCVVLADDTLPASIVIVPWKKLPGTRLSFAEVLNHSTLFQLPQPKKAHCYTKELHGDGSIRLYCQPNMRQRDTAPAEAPFVDNRLPLVVLETVVAKVKEHIVQVGNTGGPRVRTLFDWSTAVELQFLIPGRALVSRLAANCGTGASEASLRAIPWRNWGEDTRVLHTNPLWRPFSLYDHHRPEIVHGSRLLHPENDPSKYWEHWQYRLWELSSISPWAKMFVYDFDSPEAMERDIRSGNVDFLDQIVVQPSYLTPAGQSVFQDLVVTRAPYRRLDPNLQVKLDEKRCYLGEDCIVTEEKVGDARR